MLVHLVGIINYLVVSKNLFGSKYMDYSKKHLWNWNSNQLKIIFYMPIEYKFRKCLLDIFVYNFTLSN